MSGFAWGGLGFVGPVLRVEVRGTVRPQPRPRTVGKGAGRRVVSTLRDSPAARWKRLVSAEVSAAMHAAGWSEVARGVPVGLRVLVVFGTKDSARWGWLRTAVRRSDFDNIAKLLADALVGCGVMDDDGQIAAPEQLHVWGPPEQAGVVIEVGAVAPGPVPGLLSAWGVAGEGAGEDAGSTPGRLDRRQRGERVSGGVEGARQTRRASGGVLEAPGWLE